MKKKTRNIILISAITAFIITIICINCYVDRRSEVAREEFRNSEFGGKVDTIFPITRGALIEFMDSSYITLGIEGTVLLGRVHHGDSLKKIKGVNGFTIITENNVGNFIKVGR
ncbi:hypothetical protein SDC9_44740 [bioreactor metagenome]|uniref:Uncharacterized protein n=1 Tax=bioreactor metagenome TaxID=1076179 RepID=A0A644W452_9ZZZZ